MASSDQKPTRARRPSAVSRERIMFIDDIERKVSFVIAAIGALLSLVWLYGALWVGKSITKIISPVPHNGKCAVPYKHVGKFCQELVVFTLGDYWLRFLLFAMLSAALASFAYRRRRTGTVFVALFEGLAFGTLVAGPLTGVIELVFIFLAGWLLWRSYRLQKYGVATFSEVSKIQRAAKDARREGRPVPEIPMVPQTPIAAAPRAARRKRGEPDVNESLEHGPRRATEPSKRYTPKKSTKKR